MKTLEGECLTFYATGALLLLRTLETRNWTVVDPSLRTKGLTHVAEWCWKLLFSAGSVQGVSCSTQPWNTSSRLDGDGHTKTSDLARYASHSLARYLTGYELQGVASRSSKVGTLGHVRPPQPRMVKGTEKLY